MKVRRAATLSAAIGMLAALVLIPASPASAVTTSPGCSSFGNAASNFSRTFGISYFGNFRFFAGETITMTVDSMRSGTDYEIRIDGSTVATGSGVPGSVSYAFPADIAPNSISSFNSDTWSGSLSCAAALDPETPSASAPPAIPAWVQAYGREGQDSACEDGWDASWQSWAQPVTGGWVCTRSVPSLG